MATVTFRQDTLMNELPGSGDFSFHSPTQAEWTNNTYVVLWTTDLISSGPFTWEETVTRVLIDDTDGGFIDHLPNFEITGLSFHLTSAFQLEDGDLDEFVQALLEGNDTIVGWFGDDALLGFDGDDLLIGGGGGDTLDGGLGMEDTASYITSTEGVVVIMQNTSLSSGHAKFDSYISIEILVGSQFGDTIYADDNDNKLKGLAGNDMFVGLFGADRFDGGTGTDTVSYDASGVLGVRASLLNPRTNTNEAEDDTYISIENLDGSSFSDILTGNNAANRIRGSSYPGVVDPDGDDKLFGMGGNDTLYGINDNDTLVGGLGRDIQFGGGGADRFKFNAIAESVTGGNRDQLRDFNRAFGDEIDLSTIDADTSANAGNDKFKFIGTAAFSGNGGEIRRVGTILQIDVNDGVADMEINIFTTSIVSGDFVL